MKRKQTEANLFEMLKSSPKKDQAQIASEAKTPQEIPAQNDSHQSDGAPQNSPSEFASNQQVLSPHGESIASPHFSQGATSSGLESEHSGYPAPTSPAEPLSSSLQSLSQSPEPSKRKRVQLPSMGSFMPQIDSANQVLKKRVPLAEPVNKPVVEDSTPSAQVEPAMQVEPVMQVDHRAAGEVAAVVPIEESRIDSPAEIPSAKSASEKSSVPRLKLPSMEGSVSASVSQTLSSASGNAKLEPEKSSAKKTTPPAVAPVNTSQVESAPAHKQQKIGRPSATPESSIESKLTVTNSPKLQSLPQAESSSEEDEHKEVTAVQAAFIWLNESQYMRNANILLFVIGAILLASLSYLIGDRGDSNPTLTDSFRKDLDSPVYEARPEDVVPKVPLRHVKSLNPVISDGGKKDSGDKSEESLKLAPNQELWHIHTSASRDEKAISNLVTHQDRFVKIVGAAGTFVKKSKKGLIITGFKFIGTRAEAREVLKKVHQLVEYYAGTDFSKSQLVPVKNP